jgi:hypothetical protein
MQIIIVLWFILGLILLALMFVTYLIGGPELVNKWWGWTDFLYSHDGCEQGQELQPVDRWESGNECRW